MKPPLKQFVRLGLLHFMAYPVDSGEGPILETLKRITSDADFEVVEVSWIKDEAVRAEAKALLAASGMEVKYGAHPRLLSKRLDLNSLDEAKRQAALREVHDSMDEALEIGATEVCVLSGPYPGPADEGRALDLLVDSLVELGSRAQTEGLGFSLEVFDREIEKRSLVGPAATARTVAERVKERYPAFGLVVDLSHTPLLGESPMEALEPVKEHLAHVHIGNCLLHDEAHPAYGDKHPRLGYPGGVNGPSEVAEFLEALFEVGYLHPAGDRRASISFEVKPVGNEDPDAVVAASKRVLEDAWWRLTRVPQGPSRHLQEKE